MSETESGMSGFYKYDTTRFVKFTEEHLSMLERILLDYRSKPPISYLLTFYPDLQAHLDATDPHKLQMSEFTEGLMTQLYEVYISLGYTGDPNEMLEKLIKNIKVADAETITHNASRYEGINVIGWKYLFEAHAKKILSHNDRFDVFKIRGDMFYQEPVWDFTYTFASLFDPYLEDGYTLDTWNPAEGTIFFECILNDFSSKTELFQIQGVDQVLTAYSDTVEEQPYLHVALDEIPVISIPIQTRVRPFVERLAVSYNTEKNMIWWRSILYNDMSSYLLKPGVSLVLKAPLQEICGDNPAIMRTIRYYPRSMTLANMTVLL